MDLSSDPWYIWNSWFCLKVSFALSCHVVSRWFLPNWVTRCNRQGSSAVNDFVFKVCLTVRLLWHGHRRIPWRTKLSLWGWICRSNRAGWWRRGVDKKRKPVGVGNNGGSKKIRSIKTDEIHQIANGKKSLKTISHEFHSETREEQEKAPCGNEEECSSWDELLLHCSRLNTH